MKENKITQPESREIQRSDINFANTRSKKEPESKPKACRVAWWYCME